MSILREVTVRGVVVARRSAGEGSVRVSLYTDALGLMTALAKSAREERSKLRPHLQVGTTGTFTFIKGRDVWRIIGAVDTANSYFELAGNAPAQEASSRVMAIVRQFIRGEGSDPYLFSALFEFFRALPHLEERHIADAECIAVLRILSALGYVREDAHATPFLQISYHPSVLEEIHLSRPQLVRLINEGINESGL